MRESVVSRFGIQRKIVANMTSQSWSEIPHVSYNYEPDITEFYEKYKQFSEKSKDSVNITFNTILLKTIAKALKAAPKMNAHLHFEKELVRGKVTQYENIDVSLPWILPSGEMMTITLKDIGNRSVEQLQEYINGMARKIENTNLEEAMYRISLHDTLEYLKKGKLIKVILRLIGSKTGNHKVKGLKGKEKKEYEKISDKLTYHDLRQGTITMSNIGSITKGLAGVVSMLMIIPPQVVAIGVASIYKKPIVAVDENGKDAIKIAKVLPVCVCFDHRALDFGDIKPFIVELEKIFKNPEIDFESI
ncbi:MAG TPA: 2-oxo acid dehydrogenase subunit E2 [Oscillospiraceae bacterium]|nr:2-oxo acid dehydrogenase subunit E2 [Oscillospiraceae bacterium]